MAPKGKVRARRRAIMAVIVSVMLVAVLLFAVFPTRTWLEQRRETAAAQQELADLKAQRAKYEHEQEQLKTDEEIKQRAKSEFGYVDPGEELVNILPPPTDPIGLPEGWPFTGVERVFGTD